MELVKMKAGEQVGKEKMKKKNKKNKKKKRTQSEMQEMETQKEKRAGEFLAVDATGGER